MSEAAMIVILVRHGRTEWNRVERFRGRYDIPLDQTGLEQAGKTAERIAANFSPMEILTSPLTRARQTAEAVAEKTGLRPRVDPGLIDIDYGEWQGLTPEEVGVRWPAELEAWYRNPEKAVIPGGETPASVQERAVSAVFEVCGREPGRSSGSIVMVSHTVVIRMIILGIMGAPLSGFWRLKQDPCAINTLEFDGSAFAVGSVNDTCHLSGDH